MIYIFQSLVEIRKSRLRELHVPQLLNGRSVVEMAIFISLQHCALILLLWQITDAA